MHCTSSSLQLVQGEPCSTTLHRTFRVLQLAQAFEALLFTGLPLALTSAFRFGEPGCLLLSLGDGVSSIFMMAVIDFVGDWGARLVGHSSLDAGFATRKVSDGRKSG
jgi:hypothetical protein